VRPRTERRIAGLAFAASACTALTHAGDYQTQAQDGVCHVCSSNAGLRRPPCPLAGAVPGGGSGVSYFALSAVDFGEESTSWSDPARAVGLDLDCSTRVATGGGPVLCAAGSHPWELLPLGIDNALGADLIGQFALLPSLDIHTSANATQDLAQGAWGMVLAVDGWNGLPDDDVVGVRLLSARGVAGGGSPKWDGTDQWDVYSPGIDESLGGLGVPDATFKGGTAYVVGGTLVWDARSVEGAAVRFQSHGASLDDSVVDVLFVGQLAKGGVTGTLAGLFPGTAFHISYSFVASCDPAATCAASRSGVSLTAGDMRISGQPTSTGCDSMSFGVAMTFAPIAGPGALLADAPLDGPCDFMVPCEAEDASTD
jgi:hypothetical protein